MHELHQLHNEKKAHFRKLGTKTNEADLKEGSGFDESDWGDDDDKKGFAAGAVKSHKCFGVKCVWGSKIPQVFWCQTCFVMRNISKCVVS